MFEQSIKEAGVKDKGQAEEPRDEALDRPEPFRAKFRRGTPHRSDTTSQHTETTVPQHSIVPPLSTVSPRPASLAARVEIEVTGLRPVKRNAPAFFTDRSSSPHAELPVRSPDGGDSNQDQNKQISSSSPSSSVPVLSSEPRSYPEAAVPHFTDEEFDDWADFQTPKAISEQSRHSLRSEGRVPHSGPIAAGFRQGWGPEGERSQKRIASPRGGHQQSRGAPRRAIPPESRGRADDNRMGSARARHEPRKEGSATGRHHRHEGTSQGQLRQARTSRNSADLVDTTAERLYGGGAQSAPRWTGQPSHIADRQRSGSNRSRINPSQPKNSEQHRPQQHRPQQHRSQQHHSQQRARR